MDLTKTYSCLVVDDEPPAREVLRRYISQIPLLTLAGECGNALQALTSLKQQQVDILFLDIQMPQISGLDLVKTLSHPPRVILTTAFEQYAVQAFELDVVDYLVKPIQFDRFLKAVMKALPQQTLPPAPATAPQTLEQADPAFLYFRADRKMVKVYLNDILYVESLKDYVKIHTVKDMVITKYTLASLEAMLPSSGFLRVHRSFLIALAKVTSYTLDEVHMQEAAIPIGSMYRKSVHKALELGN